MTSMPDQVASNYEAPFNRQFSVFLDNRVGKLFELVELFDAHDVPVIGLSIVDAADHAVVRLLTSASDRARQLLQQSEMPYSETDVLVVQLRKGQSLSALCKSLVACELNIHYAYPLLVQPQGQPALALQSDDQTLAGQILRRKMFHLFAENDFGDNMNPGDPFDQSSN